MFTIVRTLAITPSVESTYSLSPSEAVATAYAAWKCKGHRTGMPDFEAALSEGKRLTSCNPKQPDIKRIILPQGPAWFGFPQ